MPGYIGCKSSLAMSMPPVDDHFKAKAGTGIDPGNTGSLPKPLSSTDVSMPPNCAGFEILSCQDGSANRLSFFE
jgi:hypothetical protein